MFRRSTPYLLFLTLSTAGCGRDLDLVSDGGQTAASSGARFEVSLPGIPPKKWLKVDTHVHTNFSDGKFPLLAVVERAAQHGCDVIAITDHADLNLNAASPEYFAQIRQARKRFPEMLVIAGLEWNVPPYGGDEHAVVLMAPEDEHLLTEFKVRFDDYKRPETMNITVREALAWLEASATTPPVVMLNHPSRKRSRSGTVADDFRTWRAGSELFIGFSGAPGHQRDKTLGAYSQEIQLMDRWDPVVALVGGVWDELLAEGMDVWAALSPSDFHNEKWDFWPGQFSETWVSATERSIPAVLQSLRSGSYFASHGGIAREVKLLVEADGLPRAAEAGETISLPSGHTVNVSLQLVVPATDWQGQPNAIDTIELIGIRAARSEIVATGPVAGPEVRLLSNFEVPAQGIVFRARGHRILADGSRLLFVTNPVRVRNQGGP